MPLAVSTPSFSCLFSHYAVDLLVCLGSLSHCTIQFQLSFSCWTYGLHEGATLLICVPAAEAHFVLFLVDCVLICSLRPAHIKKFFKRLIDLNNVRNQITKTDKWAVNFVCGPDSTPESVHKTLTLNAWKCTKSHCQTQNEHRTQEKMNTTAFGQWALTGCVFLCCT